MSCCCRSAPLDLDCARRNLSWGFGIPVRTTKIRRFSKSIASWDVPLRHGSHGLHRNHPGGAFLRKGLQGCRIVQASRVIGLPNVSTFLFLPVHIRLTKKLQD